jgi:hypothetical protein
MRRLLILVLALLTLPAAAQTLITVHSDLPFLPKPGQSVMPFTCNGSGLIATCYDFTTGNWKETDVRCAADDPHAPACESWLALWSYSPIHPAFSFRETQSKDEDTPYEPALLIRLTPKTERKALYALEIGFDAGSRYLVLAAEGQHAQARGYPRPALRGRRRLVAALAGADLDLPHRLLRRRVDRCAGAHGARRAAAAALRDARLDR